MKQADLNRAVARATGETIATIERLGFLLDEPTDGFDPDAPELGPYVLDWDQLEAQRQASCSALQASELAQPPHLPIPTPS